VVTSLRPVPQGDEFCLSSAPDALNLGPSAQTTMRIRLNLSCARAMSVCKHRVRSGTLTSLWQPSCVRKSYAKRSSSPAIALRVRTALQHGRVACAPRSIGPLPTLAQAALAGRSALEQEVRLLSNNRAIGGRIQQEKESVKRIIQAHNWSKGGARRQTIKHRSFGSVERDKSSGVCVRSPLSRCVHSESTRLGHARL
jgi:hypothetical protein